MIMICFSISEQSMLIKKITVINPFLKSSQTTIMAQYFLQKTRMVVVAVVLKLQTFSIFSLKTKGLADLNFSLST